MDRLPSGRQVSMGAAALMLALAGCGEVAPTVASTVGPTSPPTVGASARASADPGPTAATTPGAEFPWVRTAVSEADGFRSLAVDVVALDGGSLEEASDPMGHPAFRFPVFSESPTPARAIIRVSPPPGGTDDPLAPGMAAFSFGADFAVDAESQGTAVDGGNNLIQRGLASDPIQYKIDVDDNRPACRIQGSEGVAELRLTERVLPDVWYRARCARVGDTVELRVDFVEGASTRELETVTVQGSTGDLRWMRPTPLSVGGKLSARGEVIRSATDQFNGLVSRPILTVDDSYECRLSGEGPSCR